MTPAARSEPVRALLYARYSTAMQQEAGVEDQFRVLRQRAEREGWTIVGEHADRAISGTVRQRPGLVVALAAIERGDANVLLAESLDRISRDQEDLAGIFKRVRFRGARIVTLSEGDISTMHIGMGGTMSALFLEQLADKVRRGHIGVVESGRVPSGLSYGYRAVRELDERGELRRGLRAIDETQAAVVQRIFADYADGVSPVEIARRLNAEGVPSPRGGLWRANAISGHRRRRNGILHNELYRGRIVYNRQSFRKDPETRKRVARANAHDDVFEREAPALRIVDEALWNRAQTRMATLDGKRPEQCRRARRMLSGLMRCGECGGPVIIVSTDRWGCSNKRQTGTCGNGTTITNAAAEKRVFAAIDSHLLHPDVIAAYLDELRKALVDQRRARIADRAGHERRLAELDREEERITAAIVAGIALPGLKIRAEAIAAERERIRAEVGETEPVVPPLVHAGTIEHYKRRVAALHELADVVPELLGEARALLAALVDHVDLSPRADGSRGADLVLHGDLASLLNLAAPNAQKPATPESSGLCMLTMVAGVGFGRWRTMRIAA